MPTSSLIREGLAAVWLPGLAVSGLGVMVGLVLGLADVQRTALAVGLMVAAALAVPGALLMRIALHPGSSLSVTAVSGGQLLLKMMVLFVLIYAGNNAGWKFPVLLVLAGAFAGAAMLMQFGVLANLLRQASRQRDNAGPLSEAAPAASSGTASPQ